MYLGKRIKELRIKKGLTQLELANLLYVNDRTISKWEQERGNPDVNIIPSLAEALGVSIDYLFTGKEYIPTKDENKAKAIEYFELLIDQEITNDYTRRLIARQIEEHDLESIKNALDICYEMYLSKLEKPYESDVIREAVSKIGGILHNQSLSPFDKKIKHLISYLSKNTTKPSFALKKRCEESIRDFLTTLDDTNTHEQKIKMLDKMHNYCIERHYDLRDAINSFESAVRKTTEKRELKRRIDNGYLEKLNDSTETINQAISFVNDCIKNKDLNNLPKAVLNTFDATFRFIACEIDRELDGNKVPAITSYYEDLYIIFGSFLGKSNFRATKYLVAKYLTEDINQIDLDDLNLMHRIVSEMIYKLDRHHKSAVNNYKVDYFRK